MKHIQILLSLTLLALLSIGCGHTVKMEPVNASELLYEEPPPAAQIGVADVRESSEFVVGKKIKVDFDGEQGQEIPFFIAGLEKELTQRGISSQVAAGTGGEIQLKVKKFFVRHEQASGFSPFVTYFVFLGEATAGGRTVSIAAYTKNGKLPVWRVSEIDDPCYQVPFEVVVQEVAAKLNEEFWQAKVSDQLVNTLAARATSADDDEDMVLAAYQLAFSNNPAAVEPLVSLTESKNEEVRGAALAGLGILGGAQHLDLLKKTVKDGKSETDQLMALKAIGDVGTPEAKAFLKKAPELFEDDEEKEQAQEVISLFLP